MNIVIIGGNWDELNGKQSGYVNKLSYCLQQLNNNVTTYNGGNFLQLKNEIINNLSNHRVIIWMPNISNNYEKLLINIKRLYPLSLLVSSKRNNLEYVIQDLVKHALRVKANLLIEFLTVSDIVYEESVPDSLRKNTFSRLIDPLGNCFGTGFYSDIIEFSKVLNKRLNELLSFTRQSTIHSQDTLSFPEINDNISFFISIVRNKAIQFHELILGNEIENERFLGNCSFRCSHGFPSFRINENTICVSKRNIDKKGIEYPEGFVLTKNDDNGIYYYGDKKPSVDTPIQIQLYNLLPQINYMIHSHVYIQDAPFTKSKIPCGAIEEVKEIIDVINDYNLINEKIIYINLKGHGSIVMSNSIELLYYTINYVSRTPNNHLEYD